MPADTVPTDSPSSSNANSRPSTPPSTPSETSHSSPSSSHGSHTAVIAAVCAAVGGSLLLAAGVFLYWRRRRFPNSRLDSAQRFAADSSDARDGSEPTHMQNSTLTPYTMTASTTADMTSRASALKKENVVEQWNPASLTAVDSEWSSNTRDADSTSSRVPAITATALPTQLDYNSTAPSPLVPTSMGEELSYSGQHDHKPYVQMGAPLTAGRSEAAPRPLPVLLFPADVTSVVSPRHQSVTASRWSGETSPPPPYERT